MVKKLILVGILAAMAIMSFILFIRPAPTPTPTPAPWTFDPEWHKKPQIVAFSGIAETYLLPSILTKLVQLFSVNFDTYAKFGVTVANWNDLPKHTSNWKDAFREFVDEAHRRGIVVVGSVSHITLWEGPEDEPLELQKTILRDPYGNTFEEKSGLVHSMLHLAWQDYLLSLVKQSIEAGVDGFLFDELAYGSVFYPDFNEYTVQKFRKYLIETYSDKELKEIEQKYGIKNFNNFNYAEFVRKYLPPNMTSLTADDWGKLKWEIPFIYDYERFLRVKNREVASHLISEGKVYAKEKYGKEISFSANLNDLSAPEALYIIDLLDYVNLEWFYYLHGPYFPKARAFPSFKLAQFFGKPAFALTGYVDTVPDILKRGKKKTVNLYRTMIADAYAVGGAFHVEEGAHGIKQDIDALVPYYRFVRDRPFLFENLTPVKGKISVLHLWESLDPYRARAYRGLSNMLADAGYQFGVIFGAEEYKFWGETQIAPPYPLQLDKLSQYPVIIVPELFDVTEKHADLLLRYAENGGKLIVFATQDMLNNIQAQRGENQAVNRLLTYLRAGKATVGSGTIIYVNQVLGREYLENLDPQLRLQLRQMLSQENIGPEAKMADAKALSAFVYQGENQLVIHFVNYDYNLENDSTNPVQALELEVALGDLPREGLTAIFYSPEDPQGQQLEATIQQDTLLLTLPKINIWGTLRVST